MTTEWPDRTYQISRALNRATGKAMERIDGTCAPAYRAVGTGSAMFCGDGSPLTQVSWLCYGEDFDPAVLDEVEAFYKDRTESWEYVVHPYSGPHLLPEIVNRGWTNVQYENVLGLDLTTARILANLPVETRVAEPSESATWADISMRGFFGDDVPPGLDNLAELIAATEGTVPFLAVIDGEPVAAAALLVHGDTCYLGGAATLQEFRGQGAQTALLSARLAFARDHGCDLAFCECLPASQSQRNQERAGFQVAFTKAVLTRPPSDSSD